jgi:chaperonin GroEL (HSP60 family)
MLILLIVLATQAIANVVKSSFGPSGLDKMMVDDIGVSTWDSS